MAVPDRSPIPLGTSPHSSKPAFLVKFPQDVWERIVASGSGGVQVSHDDAKLSLVLPDRTIAMDTQTLNPTEIYKLSDSLQPLGLATTRLSVPFSVASSSKATEAARVPNSSSQEAKHRAVNGVAARVRQQAAVPLARSLSSPAAPAANGTAAPGAPVVPLKTRVVQFLALGPASVEEIVGRVGGAEMDVMRVVKVVGRQVGEHPPQYSLQPSQYAKIKLVDWRYTPAEQGRVGELAREAFDELEIPQGADERVELERKLDEAAAASPLPDAVPDPGPAGATPAGTQLHLRQKRTEATTAAPTVPLPTPPPPVPTSELNANGSSSAHPSSSRPRSSLPTVSSSSSTKKGVVAREMAKFRAEQARSTSAPASKGANGGASPRAAPPTISTTPDQASKVSKKRNDPAAGKASRSDSSGKSSQSDERDKEKGKAEKKRKRGREDSPFFSSSEDDDQEGKSRGRPKQRTGAGEAKAQPSVSVHELPAASRIPSFTKRKSPPQPLELKHPPEASTPSTTASERPDDPEELRDRYEELYPAYQLLTTKLIGLHRAAEGVEGGEGGESDTEVSLPSRGEMEKMVKKWERWHNELTGIRRWFGSV